MRSKTQQKRRSRQEIVLSVITIVIIHTVTVIPGRRETEGIARIDFLFFVAALLLWLSFFLFLFFNFFFCPLAKNFFYSRPSIHSSSFQIPPRSPPIEQTLRYFGPRSEHPRPNSYSSTCKPRRHRTNGRPATLAWLGLKKET